MIGRLPERGQGDAAVERPRALFADDFVDGVARVAVLRRLERVRERVLLRLQPDLDDFHGRHDEHGFRRPRAQSGCQPTWVGPGGCAIDAGGATHL